MIITGKKFSKPEMSRVINGDIVLEDKDARPEKFRLDHLLVEKYPEYNRSSLQTFIESGFVKVDGKVAKKPNEKYEKDVEISLNVPKKTPLRPELKPTTIYEDDNVLVLNKPSGLLSETKGEYCPEPTLSDFGFIVHRLDRDTSGVVILAKNEKTQSFLRKQFQDRKAHKTYLAIVNGHPKLDAAKINLPIARNLKRPTTFQIDPNGKPSITYYEVLKTDDKHTLIELKPVTGRTHQLRVHMNYIGNPIVGDTVYGKKEPTRLMLHARDLEITIPGKDENSDNIRKTFTAPVPPEFDSFLEG